MKKTSLAALLGATVLAMPAYAVTTVSDGIGLALSPDGSTIIVSPDLTNPQNNTKVMLTGGTDGTIDSLFYRPSNGILYGYSDEDDTVYTVNTMTGQLAKVTTSTGNARTTSPNVASDFNNMADAARIVSETGENIVFFPFNSANPNAGSNVRFTDPFFADGTPGRPQIVGNAYTNAIADPSAIPSLQQYVLLDGLEALGTLNNNAGDVSVVGELTFNGMTLDVNQSSGFDILSLAFGENLAFAQLAMDGTSALYTFDLTATPGSGPVVASLVGGYGELVRSFAVAPTDQLNQPAPIPVPAAGLLLAGGIAALGFARRRKA